MSPMPGYNRQRGYTREIAGLRRLPSSTTKNRNPKRELILKASYVLLFLVTATLLAAPASAVEARDEAYVPTRFDEADVDIRIDGKLDEEIWASLPYVDDMVVIEPDTLVQVPFETRVRYFYTEKGFYIGAWMEQPTDTLVSRLSSRDIRVQRDEIAFTLDPSGDGLYGYWFGVNLGGTLMDGTVLPERQYSNQWDGPWDGASAEHDQGWSAEFFLPWSMMSMPDGPGDIRQMRYYTSRFLAHRGERWAFPGLPRTKPVFLSQLQKLEIKNVSPRQQLTIYPFASASWDNEHPGHEDAYKAGFDIFWRPSTNLQLTATVNPDFGNVESDNVVVNLSSFETFYPEKRAFFLEGYEIFIATPRARGGQNGPPTTMINTRRIGGPPRDPEITDFELSDLEANQPSELMGAAKVTGQSGRMRWGVLGAFENDTVLHGELNGAAFDYLQEGRDFGSARFLYEDTVDGARRSLGWMSTIVAHPQGDAIVHGVDGNYLTHDGRWNVDAQVMFSDVADKTGAGGFVDLTYTPSQGYEHEFSIDAYDDELEINDLGFLRRNDYVGARYKFSRTESGGKNYKRRFTNVMVVSDYNTDGKVVRSGLFLSRERQFQNNHWWFTEFNYFPARWDDINSDGNGAFRIDDRFQLGTWYGTDESKKLWFGFSTFLYKEEIGDLSLNLNIETTWQPTDRFSLQFNLRHEDKNDWLIYWTGRELNTYKAEVWRPRIEADFFLSARQQFRLTAQWAGIKAFEQQRWEIPLGDGELVPIASAAGSSSRDFSISRLTFQARYRWEIAPLSDLYVVYTRGSDVDSHPGDRFGDLVHDSWTEPLVDIFVVKLRYRFGT